MCNSTAAGTAEPRVTALSPDNRSDVGRLIGLFRAAYGEQYPWRGVYDPMFWGVHAGVRFVSIVGWKERTPIFHLAVQPDGQRGVQLLHLAIHPEEHEAARRAAPKLRDILARLLAKHTASGMSGVVPVGSDQSLDIIREVFGLSVVSWYPKLLQESVVETENGESTHCVNQGFSVAAHRPGNSVSTVSVFAPGAMHAELQNVIQGAGYYATLHATGEEVRALVPVSADSPAMESRFLQRSGVNILSIDPALVTLAQLAGLKDPAPLRYVLVYADHPAVIGVIEMLNKSEMTLCGFLPDVRRRPAYVFAENGLIDTAEQRTSSASQLGQAPAIEALIRSFRQIYSPTGIDGGAFETALPHESVGRTKKRSAGAR